MDSKANKTRGGPVRILVVGASGRMTAAMLSRQGCDCSVADLFADRDTGLICDGRATRLSQLNDLLLHEPLVRSHDFVVFAGGLESNVELAAKLRQWTGRAFAAPRTVEKFNDFRTLNRALGLASVDHYPFHRNPMKVTLPAIAKSLNGSGRAELARNWLDCVRGFFRGKVFQNQIVGQVVSQIFASDGQSAKPLGGSTQLNAKMAWAGSISGLVLSDFYLQQSLHLATCVVELTGIQGVFGIDFIQNEEGLLPIDFNPRIPASAEIVGDHVMRAHLNLFGINSVPKKVDSVDAVQGKLVVFNTTAGPMRFELSRIADLPFRHQSSLAEDSIADIPLDGELVKRGHPVLTVFVSGKDPDHVASSLKDKSSEILHRLTR